MRKKWHLTAVAHWSEKSDDISGGTLFLQGDVRGRKSLWWQKKGSRRGFQRSKGQLEGDRPMKPALTLELVDL